MADISEITEKILSDPKIARSGNFSSRVYADEPILFAASRKPEDFTPPQIREMRKLAQSALSPNESNPRLFYRQGKFMEAFEDDHDYAGEFVHYFPTYQSMNDAQLRGYFTWRTKLRRGKLEATSLSFAFVYIYELLNQIGTPSPEAGFRMLKDFWMEYKEIDSRVNRYVPAWLRDCIVYYDLDASLLKTLPPAEPDSATAAVLDPNRRGAAEYFSALNALSSYDLSASKAYAANPADVAECVRRFFRAIPEKEREKLFGRFCATAYFPFNSAVFNDRVMQKNRTCALGENHVYRCREGEWTCERFVWHGKNNRHIGDILKTLDYFLRKSMGLKSALKPGQTNKLLTAEIEKFVLEFEAEKRAAPKVKIDVRKLRAIRAASDATRDRLLVDETDETPETEKAEEVKTEDVKIQKTSQETSAPNRPPALTETETLFLACLLKGEPCADLLRERGEMPSLLMDSINEKLFDAFSDTVLADDESGVHVIEDYKDALARISGT